MSYCLSTGSVDTANFLSSWITSSSNIPSRGSSAGPTPNIIVLHKLWEKKKQVRFVITLPGCHRYDRYDRSDGEHNPKL